MNETQKAILLVADISGYTKFMKQHAIAVNHAKQIIVRLLKALMQTAQPPLKVAELEGDAVFFYALSPGNAMEKTANQVKGQLVQFFQAFKTELQNIHGVQTCACDACDHVKDLKLKQVVHMGDVAIEKIGKFEKLFGIDVILVHRMLKNSVPSNEYVMMTDPLYIQMRDFYGLEPERRKETFDGVGDVETLVFYAHHLPEAPVASNHNPSSFIEKVGWRAKISSGFMLHFLGVRRIQGEFNNVPD